MYHTQISSNFKTPVHAFYSVTSFVGNIVRRWIKIQHCSTPENGGGALIETILFK